MTWTYSGDPASSDRDAVRFTVGDTDSTEELVTDEEITYLLGIHNGVGMASVGAARSIAAKFSRKADQSRAVGDLSLSQQYSQQSFNYHHLADHLLAIASGIDAPPLAKANADALGAEFTIGLLDKFTL